MFAEKTRNSITHMFIELGDSILPEYSHLHCSNRNHSIRKKATPKENRLKVKVFKMSSD